MTMSPLNVRRLSEALPSPNTARTPPPDLARVGLSCCSRGRDDVAAARLAAECQRELRPHRPAEACRVQLEPGAGREREADVARVRADVVASVSRQRSVVVDASADRSRVQPFAARVAQRDVAADRADIERHAPSGRWHGRSADARHGHVAVRARRPSSSTSPETVLAYSTRGAFDGHDVAADALQPARRP